MSVVVPVYNPGHDIDDCIRTLLDQSLPPSEHEVILVDDGSTDATPARLDQHAHVRVEHIPNSGWPGMQQHSDESAVGRPLVAPARLAVQLGVELQACLDDR